MTSMELRNIQQYIDKCVAVISEENKEKAKILQEEILGVFSNCIPKIRESLTLDFSEIGKPADYIFNINLLKQKLERHIAVRGIYPQFTNNIANINNINKNDSSVSDSGNSTNNNSNTNTNTINTTFDIKTELDKARKEIEENEYLDDDAKAEINEQLDQIESVMGEDQSNNEKWKKLKSVVNWVAEKGYKIGELFMPLLTKALFPDAE